MAGAPVMPTSFPTTSATRPRKSTLAQAPPRARDLRAATSARDVACRGAAHILQRRWRRCIVQCARCVVIGAGAPYLRAVGFAEAATDVALSQTQ